MVRRIAAAVALLAAVVLLHFVTPHHAASPSFTAAATAPAVESDTGQSYGSAQAPKLTDADSAHAQTEADSPALAPRSDRPVEVSAHADDRWTGTAEATEIGALARAAQPRTAREVWSPASALPPDAATLQTFRC